MTTQAEALKIALIVGGLPVTVEAMPHETLASLLNPALNQAGIVAIGSAKWLFKTEAGELLDETAQLSNFNLTMIEPLFLCREAGIAAATVSSDAQPVACPECIMGWSIGYDNNWKRDIGYGVPAYCDHPGCGAEIDRGISRVCGGGPYGGDRGCGLHFCGEHLRYHAKTQLCSQCAPRKKKPFEPTPDHPKWIQHKLTDESWSEWRIENKELVAKMREQLSEAESAPPETK